MRFEIQWDTYSCGVHSVRNCAALMGTEISFQQARKITGAKTYLESAQQYLINRRVFRNPIVMFRKFILRVGTSEKGIMQGLTKLGLKYKEFYSEDPKKFLKFLDKQQEPVIMLVNYTMKSNDYGHWVVCGSKRKGKYEIIDSAPHYGNARQYYSTRKLLNRFLWYDEDGEGYYEFYGIAVQKK